MATASAALADLGLRPEAIRREDFDLPPTEADDEPPILIAAAVGGSAETAASSGVVAFVGGENYDAIVSLDQSLLAALIAAGAPVPWSCQEGTCASCICKLTAGRVALKAAARAILSEADLGDGLILACLSRAETERVEVDFDNL
jgi:ferredoxin